MNYMGLFLISSLMISCSDPLKDRPHIMVFAIDQLSVDDLSCGRFDGAEESVTKEPSAFRDLCDESVRFTHAFAPSTLARPSLTSILVADHPQKHGVWTNGSEVLNAEIETAAELAYSKGYRTGLFSAGAPITRIANIQQGFEVVQDTFALNSSSLFKPVHEIIPQVQSWFDKNQSAPVFSVVYLSDLLFPNFERRDSTQQLRPNSREAALEDIDEKLGLFFEYLRESDQWHNSFIVVAGLNGKSSFFRKDLPKPLNLFFENTAVGLFIKPQTKKRDAGIHWKIDRNVSLVDVGATLFELLGKSKERSESALFSVESLLSEVKNSSERVEVNRFFLIESSWPSWMKLGSSRFGARIGHTLYLHDKKATFYNSLLDRAEVSPIEIFDDFADQQRKQFTHLLSSEGFEKFSPIQGEFRIQLNLLKRLLTSVEVDLTLTREVVEVLNLKTEEKLLTEQIAFVYLKKYLESKNFKFLIPAEVLTLIDNDTKFLASTLVEEGNSSTQPSSCIKNFSTRRFEDIYRYCTSPDLRLLYRYIAETDSTKKQSLGYRLARSLVNRKIDDAVAKQNILLDFVWFPYHQYDFGISKLQLILNFPKFSLERQQIERMVSELK